MVSFLFVVYFKRFFSNSDYRLIASNEGVIREQRIGKNVEGSGRGLI
jgi:hypothetical protein